MRHGHKRRRNLAISDYTMPKRPSSDYRILKPTPLWRVAAVKRQTKCRRIDMFGACLWPKRVYKPNIYAEDRLLPKYTLDTLTTGCTTANTSPKGATARRSDEIESPQPRIIKRKDTTIVKQPILGSFCLGLKPDKVQRKALDLQLRVAAHAYNLCVYLLNETDLLTGVKKASDRKQLLQKYVVTNDIQSVPEKYRMPSDKVIISKTNRRTPVTPGRNNDDWYFAPHINSTCVKLLAMHMFYDSWKSSMSRLKGDQTKFAMKYRAESAPTGPPPQTGVIGVQHMFIKKFAQDDPRKLLIMPAILNQSSKKGDKNPIRVNKGRYPPITNDVKIIKRPNGKYCMMIPIDDLR